MGNKIEIAKLINVMCGLWWWRMNKRSKKKSQIEIVFYVRYMFWLLLLNWNVKIRISIETEAFVVYLFQFASSWNQLRCETRRRRRQKEFVRKSNKEIHFLQLNFLLFLLQIDIGTLQTTEWTSDWYPFTFCVRFNFCFLVKG